MNPYRFDGRDGVCYDASTGLDWMSVRAYDPSVGRFLSRDPLGRAPLFFADNPYVYAGNNPLSNVDPSGQYRAAGFGSKVHESWKATKKMMARVVSYRGTPASSTSAGSCGGCQIKTVQMTPPPPAHDGYGCVVGDHACDAQQMAVSDVPVWVGIGVALGLIGAMLLALIAVPFVGAAFGAAGWTFMVAAGIATVIGALIGAEGGRPEAWYMVRDNVTGFASQIETALTALTALTAIIATFLVAIPPAAAIAGAVKVVSLAVGIGFLALFRKQMDAQEQTLGYL